MTVEKEETAFCELLRLAIDHAPNDEAKRSLSTMLVEHCSGIEAQGDTGDNGPQPK